MGRKYAIAGSASNYEGYALIGLTGATTVRPKIFDVVIGSPTAPGSNACGYDLYRFTAQPTTGLNPVTPVALDPSYPASSSSGWKAPYTDNPTVTTDAVLLSASIPQRVTFRWVSKIKTSLIVPAIADNGISIMFGFRVGSLYTSVATITFEE